MEIRTRLGRLRLVRTVVGAVRPVYRRWFPWTGLNGLDRAVVPYLTVRGGFFIEAGANDGIKQSNTHYLEKRAGWHGLLVEPVPSLAERCRRNRPGSRVVNAALVSPDQDGSSVTIIDVDLMSVVADHRWGSALEEHLRSAELAQGVARQAVEVQGRALSALLDEMGQDRIDFMSLDVEGHELSVLAGLDLTRHRPLFLLVETDDPDGVAALLGMEYSLTAQLTAHDYLFEDRRA